MFDLKGRRALVTGSTQGIGYSVAKTLAERGASVFVHGSTDEKKCARASETIVGSTPVLADLSRDGAADALFRATGEVDILVLNASIQLRSDWTRITPADFERQVRVNLIGSLELMQRYIPGMKAKGWGRIVTVGSVNQYKQNPALAAYAATKSAQYNLSQNLARELARDGITVNNLAPGVIATPRNDEALADEAYREKILGMIPCGFAGEPEDVSPAVLLLCSEEGRYITGIDLIVDGGMHL